MTKKRPPRVRRTPTPQPRIFTQIGSTEARAIINNRHEAFFFGDGKTDPNSNDGAFLTREIGATWLKLAADVARGLKKRKNRAQWKGSVLHTALDKAENNWRTQNGHNRKTPLIYKVNAEAMRAQLAWARANGADV